MFTIIGVGCLFACIMAAIQKPAVMMVMGAVNFGLFVYSIYYFWKNALTILDIPADGVYEKDPGFATFIIKAIFYLTMVG